MYTSGATPRSSPNASEVTCEHTANASERKGWLQPGLEPTYATSARAREQGGCWRCSGRGRDCGAACNTATPGGVPWKVAQHHLGLEQVFLARMCATACAARAVVVSSAGGWVVVGLSIAPSWAHARGPIQRRQWAPEARHSGHYALLLHPMSRGCTKAKCN